MTLSFELPVITSMMTSLQVALDAKAFIKFRRIETGIRIFKQSQIANLPRKYYTQYRML
jgi:hypothetical protein